MGACRCGCRFGGLAPARCPAGEAAGRAVLSEAEGPLPAWGSQQGLLAAAGAQTPSQRAHWAPGQVQTPHSLLQG